MNSTLRRRQKEGLSAQEGGRSSGTARSAEEPLFTPGEDLDTLQFEPMQFSQVYCVSFVFCRN